jgi:hypothetical protein
VATNCGVGVYLEPDPNGVDKVGSVLIRSNQFLNVDSGIYLFSHSAGQFDSLACLGNEMELNGIGGWGLAACDVCEPGPSGWITNLTALNNVVRHADWSLRPASADGGLQYSDIHNAVFANNVLGLGTMDALRVRQCPAGFIPPPPLMETCDSIGPIVSPGPTTYPPCLDVLPPGYRRAWLNNRDVLGASLKVRFFQTNSDGFASQQQWP